jgi:hypothetical protein
VWRWSRCSTIWRTASVFAEAAPEPGADRPASLPFGSINPDEPPGAVEPPTASDPPAAPVGPPDVIETPGAVSAGAVVAGAVVAGAVVAGAVADVPVVPAGLPIPEQAAASATPPPAAMTAIDAAAAAALRPSFVIRTSCVS